MSTGTSYFPQEEALAVSLYEHELPTHCNYCLVPNVALKRCGACTKLFYCSSDCQKKDWLQHKLECKTIKERSFEGGAYHRLVMRLIALYRAEQFGEIEFMNETRSLKTLCSNKKIITKEFESFYNFFKNFAIDCGPEELVRKLHLNALYNSFMVRDHIGNDIGRGFCIKLSKLPHSCKPSTRTVFKLRTAITTSNYRKEIDFNKDTRSYIDELQPLWKRKEILKNAYNIDCQCEGCLDEIRNAKMESWHCINCEKGWLKNNETAKCEECGWQITKEHYELCMIAESAAKEGSKTMDRYDIPQMKKKKIGEKLMLLFSGTLHKQNVYRLPILRELHQFNVVYHSYWDALDYGKQYLHILKMYCTEDDVTVTFLKFIVSNGFLLTGNKGTVKETIASLTPRFSEIYGEDSPMSRLCRFYLLRL